MWQLNGDETLRSAAVGWGLPAAEMQGVERALLLGAAQTALVFDGEPGFAYVVKDAQGRYVSFNASVLHRLGVGQASALQGQEACDLWPAELAQRYAQQDRWVMEQRRPLLFQLDPIVLPNRQAGWCVTHKYPLQTPEGSLVGILCLSHDVAGLPRRDSDWGLMRAVDRMSKGGELRLPMGELAELAEMSTGHFAKVVRRIFGMSPTAFIVRQRVHQACHLLRGRPRSLLDVALSCGFYDQAQFSRQFRRVTGLSPSGYRQHAVAARAGGCPWEGFRL